MTMFVVVRDDFALGGIAKPVGIYSTREKADEAIVNRKAKIKPGTTATRSAWNVVELAVDHEIPGRP